MGATSSRHVAGDRAERAEAGDGLRAVVEHERVGDLGADRMQEELERRDDAEVAAAAAQRPEQVRVLLGGRPDQLALRGHQLGRDQVVAGEAVLAPQPADAAAEREAGHPRLGDQAGRSREPVGLRRGVHLAPDGAALDASRGGAPRRPSPRSCGDRSITTPPSLVARPATLCPPPRTAIGRPAARATPTAAATSSLVATARHRDRPLVDHPVPHGTGRVVSLVAGAHHLSRQVGPQRAHDVICLTRSGHDDLLVKCRWLGCSRHLAIARPADRRREASATPTGRSGYSSSHGDRRRSSRPRRCRPRGPDRRRQRRFIFVDRRSGFDRRRRRRPLAGVDAAVEAPTAAAARSAAPARGDARAGQPAQRARPAPHAVGPAPGSHRAQPDHGLAVRARDRRRRRRPRSASWRSPRSGCGSCAATARRSRPRCSSSPATARW